MQLHLLVGLGGVTPKENHHACAWNNIIRFITPAIILALLTHWALHSHTAPIRNIEIIFDIIIWSFFTLDMSVALLLVKNKIQHIKRNWLKLLIVLLIILPLFDKNILILYRYIDPVLALLLLTVWSDQVMGSLSDNRLATTLITFFAVIVVSGFLMAGIDPSIHTPWQGFWYVLVTMSTVGYGDYVPSSLIGQILASILILLGLGFFAIVTANFAAIFVRRNVKQIAEESHEILHILEGLSKLKTTNDTFVRSIKDVEKRLTKLEHKIKDRPK